MITVRAAKSKLENQEGMNHLWVRLEPIGDVENARIQIILPPGIFRGPNMNNFYENDAGELVIYQPNVSVDFFVEIYTREPVRCGSKSIVFALSYNDKNGAFNRVEHFVLIEAVDEDEMNEVYMDEEVVNKIKELQQFGEGNKNSNEFSASKVLKINPGQLSDLEKKYRIEGGMTVPAIIGRAR
jgi:hypothetical protein